MANNIKGITIEIGGDTSKLDKALSGVNGKAKVLQNELKAVNQALKLDPKNTELLEKKQQILAESIQNTQEKLKLLKTAQEQAREAFEKGELPEEKYRALETEIIQTENELKSLTAEALKSKTTWKDVGNSIQEAGGKIEDVGKKMSAVSAGIAAVGAASIAAAQELDEGYDTIITKTGATGEALEGMQDQMDRIFADIPTDAAAAGTAVGEVNTRFGLLGDELGDLSKDFIEFAEINGTDLNNSIDSVDSIMTKFEVDASKTTSVLGLMTKAGQDTGLSMDDLYHALETNGATLKEMGLGLEESVNLLAQFEASGVDTSTALAALKKAQQNATAEGKTLDEALNEQISAIQNAKTETEALQIATDLFGKKGAAEMTQAIREGRFSIDDLSASLDDYATTVEDTYNSTLDPWDQMTVATNNLKISGAELAASLLQTLQPVIDGLVSKVKTFTEWFKNLDESQKQMIIRIGLVVAAIGPALVIIGKLTSGVGGAITKIAALGAKLGGLPGILSAIASPVGIVVAAIAALIAIFVHLYNTNDEFKAKVQETVEKIKEAFQGMIEKIQPILEQMKQAFENLLVALEPVFEFIITYIGAVVNGVINAVGPILSAITNVINFVTNVVQAFIALFHGDIDGFLSYIMAAFQNAFDFVSNILQAWVAFAIGFFEGFGVNIQQVFSNIWIGIQNIFANVGAWFQNLFMTAYNGIVTAFSPIGQWFGARWQDIQMIFSVVTSFFSTTFNNAVSAIKQAFNAIPSFFSGIWQRILTLFTGAGEKVAEAFSGAFKSAINSVFGTVENIVNGFVDSINGIIGIINEIPGVSVGSLSRLSLPRLAKGGVLKQGTAIVAEAGPELITQIGGKTIVTPLSGVTKNTPAAAGARSGDFYQTNYYQSPKALSPYEAARQTKIATQNMILRLQKG